MTSYRVTDLVSGLPATVPFVGPEAQERAQGRVFDARIGANENMFGPSPAVIEAIIQTAGDAWMYGDPELHELRHAIARHHEIPVENIAIGEGIDGLLGYFSRIFIEPGDSVVTSAGAYPTFNYHVVGYGGKLETVPYRDDHEDIEGLLNRAADVKAKLLYVANPDNPMGIHAKNLKHIITTVNLKASTAEVRFAMSDDKTAAELGGFLKLMLAEVKKGAPAGGGPEAMIANAAKDVKIEYEGNDVVMKLALPIEVLDELAGEVAKGMEAELQ